MKYFVLGKKDSPLLSLYLDKYFTKISQLLQLLLKENIISVKVDLIVKENYRDFILHPDISTLVLYLYDECILNKNQWLWDPDFYRNTLEKQCISFAKWDKESLCLYDGVSISNTDIKLSAYDHNPYNVFGTNRIDSNADMWWWNKSEQDWMRVCAKTFQALKELDEWTYDELNQVIKKIVPIGTSEWNHNSASYTTCVWTLYMWYTTDAVFPEFNILEAIIHESSHNKLLLIKQFHQLVCNNKEEKYYSPYRWDARHMDGVYIWIHAFVPVVFFLMKAYQKGMFIGQDQNKWLLKIVLFYIKNKLCLSVIDKYAILDSLWIEILDEIREVMSMTDDIFKNMKISPEVVHEAKDIQMKHFQDVNLKYPYLQY